MNLLNEVDTRTGEYCPTKKSDDSFDSFDFVEMTWMTPMPFFQSCVGTFLVLDLAWDAIIETTTTTITTTNTVQQQQQQQQREEHEGDQAGASQIDSKIMENEHAKQKPLPQIS